MENCIIVNGTKHNFVKESNKKKELCLQCSLKELCYEKLLADNMICRLFFNDKIKNGSFQLDK